jgi:hypothetical protein
MADAALGELPGLLANALGPQQLAARVADDDADIWSEPLRIYHRATGSCR